MKIFMKIINTFWKNIKTNNERGMQTLKGFVRIRRCRLTLIFVTCLRLIEMQLVES